PLPLGRRLRLRGRPADRTASGRRGRVGHASGRLRDDLGAGGKADAGSWRGAGPASPDRPAVGRPPDRRRRVKGWAAGAARRRSDFALASALSSVCRELDVDVIRDWNTGHPETWGTIGHYLIGARACTVVTNAKLKKLLANNADRISVSDEAIKTRNLNKQP